MYPKRKLMASIVAMAAAVMMLSVLCQPAMAVATELSEVVGVSDMSGDTSVYGVNYEAGYTYWTGAAYATHEQVVSYADANGLGYNYLTVANSTSVNLTGHGVILWLNLGITAQQMVDRDILAIQIQYRSHTTAWTTTMDFYKALTYVADTDIHTVAPPPKSGFIGNTSVHAYQVPYTLSFNGTVDGWDTANYGPMNVTSTWHIMNMTFDQGSLVEAAEAMETADYTNQSYVLQFYGGSQDWTGRGLDFRIIYIADISALQASMNELTDLAMGLIGPIVIIVLVMGVVKKSF
jgi:hypothetical protein